MNRLLWIWPDSEADPWLPLARHGRGRRFEWSANK